MARSNQNANERGEIVLLNLQAEKQFGYPRDELVGQQVSSIIPQGFAERLIADGTRTAAQALAQQIGTGLELSGRRKDGTAFPAVLLEHGINDPRVEPWMSAKLTARLQAANKGPRPILFRVDYGGGHGIGDTRQQRQSRRADEWAFLLWQFGEPGFQPKE